MNTYNTEYENYPIVFRNRYIERGNGSGIYISLEIYRIDTPTEIIHNYRHPEIRKYLLNESVPTSMDTIFGTYNWYQREHGDTLDIYNDLVPGWYNRLVKWHVKDHIRPRKHPAPDMRRQVFYNDPWSDFEQDFISALNKYYAGYVFYHGDHYYTKDSLRRYNNKNEQFIDSAKSGDIAVSSTGSHIVDYDNRYRKAQCYVKRALMARPEHIDIESEEYAEEKYSKLVCREEDLKEFYRKYYLGHFREPDIYDRLRDMFIGSQYCEDFRQTGIKLRKRTPSDAHRNFCLGFVKVLNKYNAEHENYPIVFHTGYNEENNNSIPSEKDMTIRVYPEDTPAEIIKDRNHPEYETYSKIVCSMMDFYNTYYVGHNDEPDIMDRLVCMWYAAHVVNEFAVRYSISPRNTIFAAFRKRNEQPFMKNHDVNPRNVEPRNPEKLTAQQTYMLFCQNFTAALNQYNAENEDYPIIFHMGRDRFDYDPELPFAHYFKERGIMDYTIRAYPINSPAEIVNDSEHPEYERYSKIVCGMRDFYSEHCVGHQNEDDIFDRLVPIWYETYVVNEFAKDNNIASRKKDPWDCVRKR